jgi:hypothetical protein
MCSRYVLSQRSNLYIITASISRSIRHHSHRYLCARLIQTIDSNIGIRTAGIRSGGKKQPIAEIAYALEQIIVVVILLRNSGRRQKSTSDEVVTYKTKYARMVHLWTPVLPRENSCCYCRNCSQLATTQRG